MPLKKDLEAARMDSQTAAYRLSEAMHSIEELKGELERLKRASAAAREGDRIEKVALESRCQRAAELLEAEILLRRQAEGKAGRCDKAEETCARIVTEVYMSVRLSVSQCVYVCLRLCISVSIYMYVYFSLSASQNLPRSLLPTYVTSLPDTCHPRS